jgi:protease II
MRKRVGNDSREEIVIDQNDIAKRHRYVGVMNERVSRDEGQVKVAFAVDTDGHQRWQVIPCTRARIHISS